MRFDLYQMNKTIFFWKNIAKIIMKLPNSKDEGERMDSSNGIPNLFIYLFYF